MIIWVYYLFFIEWTSRLINIHMGHPLGSVAYEGVLVMIIFNIVVFENLVIIIVFPINSIKINIVNVLIISGIDTSWVILNHSEEKHIPWATFAFTTYGGGVIIPGLGPFKGILVDGIEE